MASNLDLCYLGWDMHEKQGFGVGTSQNDPIILTNLINRINRKNNIDNSKNKQLYVK